MTPSELLDRAEYQGCSAYHMRNERVVGMFYGFEGNWPGTHNGVEEWYALQNGWAVALARGKFGWYFPVVRHRLRRKR